MNSHNNPEYDCQVDMNKQLREVLRKLETIELAIVGDTTHGIEGLVKRLGRAEKEIESLREWKRKFTFKLAYTVGIVNGIVFGSIEGIAKLLEALHHAK